MLVEEGQSAATQSMAAQTSLHPPTQYIGQAQDARSDNTLRMFYAISIELDMMNIHLTHQATSTSPR
jgi:hypothetical protein